MARVRAGRIGSVALRPAAQPVDTFARPQAPTPPSPPSSSNALASLGQGLRGLVPSLEAYLDREHDEMLERENQRSLEDLYGMSMEEARELVQSGQLPERENPYYAAAMNRNYGTRLGLAARDDAIKRYGGAATDRGDPFDVENGDMDAWVSQIISQDLDGLEGEFARAGYMSVMGDVHGQLTRASADAQGQIARVRAQDAVHTEWYADTQALISRGATPQQIAQHVWSSFDSNSALLGLTRDEQRDAVVALAEQLARDGEFEVVHSLLMDPVNEHIGAIGRSRRYSQVSSDILRVAGENLASHAGQSFARDLTNLYSLRDRGYLTLDHIEQFNRLHPENPFSAPEAARMVSAADRARQAALEDMETADARTSAIMAAGARLREYDQALIDGNLDVIVPRDGDYVPDPSARSGLQHRSHEQLVQDITDRMYQRVTAGEVPFSDFAAYLDKNGIVYNLLERQFANAAAHAGSLPQATSADALQELIPVFETYRTLSAADRGIALDHVSADANVQALYEAYIVARNEMGQGEQRAMQTVYTISQRRRDTDEVRAMQLQLQDLRTAIAERDVEGAGVGQAAGILERTASVYLWLGYSPDQALARATEAFDEAYDTILGVPFRSGSREILSIEQQNGRDFEEVLRHYVRTRMVGASLPEGITSDQDVELIQSASGVYQLYSTETLNPVIDLRGGPPGQPFIFTLDDVLHFETEVYPRVLAAQADTARGEAVIAAEQTARAAETLQVLHHLGEQQFTAALRIQYATELRNRVRDGSMTIEQALADYEQRFGQQLLPGFFHAR